MIPASPPPAGRPSVPTPRARGDARTSDGAPVVAARLLWTDPETGDRLQVEILGTEAFLAGLARLGFEVERTNGEYSAA